MGAEAVEDKQKQHVTSVILKHEAAMRNKALAKKLRDIESNKTMDDAKALINNCNMQTIKRQVGKALGGSASLQPQRDLIYGICKILGIKRATKKKKKRSKKKDHGIIAADLPKVL